MQFGKSLITFLLFFVGTLCLAETPGFSQPPRARHHRAQPVSVKPKTPKQTAKAQAQPVNKKNAEPRYALNETVAPIIASRPPQNVRVAFDVAGNPKLSRNVDFSSIDRGKFVLQTEDGDKVYFTPTPSLQEKAEELLIQNAVPWGAIVAIDPRSGKVLAYASHSTAEPQGEPVASRATFPAASLFKLITASAAIEQTALAPDARVYYRGGDYMLSKRNYIPNQKLDVRSMTFTQALAKSCNPVFGRISLERLSPTILNTFARRYWFNREMAFELPVPASNFATPTDDYELARTGAGFGDVTISPLHAALITSAIANRGRLMAPHIVDTIVDPQGRIKYQAKDSLLATVTLDQTAETLLEMMEATTTEGTARKHFRKAKVLKKLNISVAGKTGTLSGENPKGRYHWFVAAAPANKPEIALAALVIDRGGARINGTGLGTRFLEYYLTQNNKS